MKCADCGREIELSQREVVPGATLGSVYWELEDGRTVCRACCAADTKKVCDLLVKAHKAAKAE